MGIGIAGAGDHRSFLKMPDRAWPRSRAPSVARSGDGSSRISRPETASGASISKGKLLPLLLPFWAATFSRHPCESALGFSSLSEVSRNECTALEPNRTFASLEHQPTHVGALAL